MNISSLEEFQRIISYSNKLNESKDTPTFIYLYNGYIKMANCFRIQNMDDCIGIAVIGRKKWRNGPYLNTSATTLALADHNFNIIYSIDVGNGYKLHDIEFETYTSTYYDEFKPILNLENKTTHERINLHLDEEQGWENDFPALFKKMFALIEG